MSILAELRGWLEDNPPENMPFYPGASSTGRLDLRSSRPVLNAGASPLHLGVDRAGPRRLHMPFDGTLVWKFVGGVAGSVLRLAPFGLDLQIQVFHTELDGHVQSLMLRPKKGEVILPVPGNLGLSIGIHTHTEVLMPYDEDLFRWASAGVHPLVTGGVLDAEEVAAHCELFDLDEQDFLTRAKYQISTWGITHYYPQRFAVRKELPSYRSVPWAGPTMHMDSLWLLDI